MSIVPCPSPATVGPTQDIVSGRLCRRRVLDKGDIVALEEDLACRKSQHVRQDGGEAQRRNIPSGRLVSSLFVLVICFTSTASSMTRFMNSSNPCPAR